MISFTKMHGAGNDYIYVNGMLYNISNPEMLAIKLSDRHKGVGSDGLVIIDKSPVIDADYSMRIFNADGSEAMMCGNAARCIGKYLYERHISNKTEINLYTLSGIKKIMLNVKANKVDSVTVDMSTPIFNDEQQFVHSKDCGMGTFVSMGNPHYVIFTDDVDKVVQIGSSLEHHVSFPQRCNIEFANVLENNIIRTRVWERGSGITMACGSGACATAVAAVLTEKAGRMSKIIMDGGSLDIEWKESDNHVYLTGPAEFVFNGEIEI